MEPGTELQGVLQGGSSGSEFWMKRMVRRGKMGFMASINGARDARVFAAMDREESSR